MTISRDVVLHVARLARLDLTEPEVERMVKDLGSILEHVAKLGAVDTAGVAGTSYVAVEHAPFRPDVVVPGVPPDVALSEAPRQADGGFAVPGFVDE
jgi:aspartyl-tRNA(Asn)/glutamyl-tRNA(Gln) amidotransferase subunit C